MVSAQTSASLRGGPYSVNLRVASGYKFKTDKFEQNKSVFTRLIAAIWQTIVPISLFIFTWLFYYIGL
jgi:hypothetical protein